MREIKFRLIKNNKIVGYEKHSIAEQIKEHGIQISHNGNIVAGNDDTFYKCGTEYSGWIEHDSKDQFTSLLDKKGKGIYEGDIVKFLWSDNGFAFSWKGHGEYGISEVRYHESYFTFDGMWGFEGMEIPLTETEVIGNIYETPELLKEKT